MLAQKYATFHDLFDQDFESLAEVLPEEAFDREIEEEKLVVSAMRRWLEWNSFRGQRIRSRERFPRRIREGQKDPFKFRLMYWFSGQEHRGGYHEKPDFTEVDAWLNGRRIIRNGRKLFWGVPVYESWLELVKFGPPKEYIEHFRVRGYRQERKLTADEKSFFRSLTEEKQRHATGEQAPQEQYWDGHTRWSKPGISWKNRKVRAQYMRHKPRHKSSMSEVPVRISVSRDYDAHDRCPCCQPAPPRFHRWIEWEYSDLILALEEEARLDREAFEASSLEFWEELRHYQLDCPPLCRLCDEERQEWYFWGEEALPDGWLDDEPEFGAYY